MNLLFFFSVPINIKFVSAVARSLSLTLPFKRESYNDHHAKYHKSLAEANCRIVSYGSFVSVLIEWGYNRFSHARETCGFTSKYTYA
jgi:hypothetical protein